MLYKKYFRSNDTSSGIAGKGFCPVKLRTLTLGIVLAATAALPACTCTRNDASAAQETSIRHIYRGNPLATRSDLQKAAVDILRPLLPYYSDGKARLHQGYTGASYPDSTAEMEAFSRPVWALGPLWAGGGRDSELWNTFMHGLISGTDPANPEYWGNVGDYDQKIVEMAAIGLALAIAPEQVWEPLTKEQQDNVYNWLNNANLRKAWPCNWEMFRVVVNLGFRRVGRPYDKKSVESALNAIEPWYLGNGWYTDGENAHVDHYNSWGMHFYCLLYAALMKDEDPVRAELYKERARVFAQDYMYYFGDDGSAIPYGRSLAYRFAEAAFWAAYAYADVGGIEPGVLKGLFLRNMRKWLSRPIFDTSGVLTVGYAYPNMSMAESYNGFGSVYWGMKSFLVLALPEDHPFWAAEELPMPELPASRRMDGPHFIAQRDGAHCVFFAAGQKPRMQHTHGQAKYEKFAYSNLYGFGVPKGPYGLSQIVPDSMLAVTDVGSDRYAVKRDTKDYEVTDDWIRTDWSPLMGVTIHTWIVPALPWHVRIHEITADRPLQTFDGGFAFPADGVSAKTDRKSVFVSQSGGMSCGAVDLFGGRSPVNQNTEPNTNLILPRATIPGLQGNVPKGTSTLVSAFYCGTGDRGATPSVTTSDDAYTVRIGGRTVIVPRRK